MTVGVPGGEYAVRAESKTDAVDVFTGDFTSYCAQAYVGLYREGTLPHIRPCPPDLVEWIEQLVAGGVWSITKSGMQIVPGGWALLHMHQNIERNDQWSMEYVTSAVFVPVAGTAGLTILEMT
jgi:hypothetical protein